MSFDDKWEYPADHPIKPEQAKALIAGDLGAQYRDILAHACSPIYWHSGQPQIDPRIQSNGTVTYARIGSETVGITAAHVVRGFEEAKGNGPCVLQIGNAAYDLDIIAIDDALDLAVLRLPTAMIASLGKPIIPLSLCRPGDVVQEQRGIMLAGFPGEDRLEGDGKPIGWGLLVVIGVARRVNEMQITWSPDYENHIPAEGIPDLERNKNFGGISGGPLIGLFEKGGGSLQYFSLAGIVVQANTIFGACDVVVARRLDSPQATAVMQRVMQNAAR
jgi:hypothetical protein